MTFWLAHYPRAVVSAGRAVACADVAVTFPADTDELTGAVGEEVGVRSTIGNVDQVVHLGGRDGADTDDAELAVRVAAQYAAALGLG